MIKYWIFLIVIFLSCSEKREIKDKTIISVAEAVGTGEILNLSDYAKSVKYIPLETNDSVLVGHIENVIYENGHISLYDFQEGLCLLFREDGSYKSRLGQKGHGPGEYSFIRAMSLMPESGNVFLSTNEGYYVYNLDGVFEKSMPRIEVPPPFFEPTTVPITDELFLSHLVALNDLRYKALIWGKKDTSRVYELCPANTGWKYSEELYSYTVSTCKWRFGDQIRCYWPATDTIFTVGSDVEMRKAFVIDLGIYKRPLKWILGGAPWREVEVSKTISVGFDISESSRYLFLDFNMHVLAPEVFTYKRHNPRGYVQEVEVTNAYALFDKESGVLTLLNQPVKHKYLGFRNDLDNGPCFWPKYISSENEMVTWWGADEFLEIYEQLPNPSVELKAVAEKLSPDDNPVLMIVTLK